ETRCVGLLRFTPSTTIQSHSYIFENLYLYHLFDMAPSSELTPALRERICELHSIGWGYKRIHKRYPWISLGGIRYTIKKEPEASCNEPPPPYDVAISGDSIEASTSARDDGRVDVSISVKQSALSSLLRNPVQLPAGGQPASEALDTIVPLNIVIQIVGSRGDVQPFIALGVRLQAIGHRVRVATHGNFKDFVQQTGLEFYSIGGNPEELMSASKLWVPARRRFMVRNPGIIPHMSTIASGEIGLKRQMIAEMLDGSWRSCIEPDTDTGIPFVADAIIANPPSFAHVHCAQALGVPLHIMFTMPWSPTREFPHPLANIIGSSKDASANNYVSYTMVELLTWSGLADIVNKWRMETLNLEELSLTTAVGIMEAFKVPHTYCWSPALVKKPSDWQQYIDVCGFFIRDPPPYTPPSEILQFLNGGPPPIYIGFGSIVVDDSTALTLTIQASCQQLGIRAIVSKGWSKLGSKIGNTPDILFIDDCPHEWLFKYVTAVVHHGGAGTTACGLLNGCPTAIIPFFGDQPFWASMVAAAGAGPAPIHFKSLTVKRLAEAIQFCMTTDARQAAASIAAMMKREDGVANAVTSFHRHLPWRHLCCDLLPNEHAVWSIDQKGLKISHKALAVLSQHDMIDLRNIKLYRSKQFRVDKKAWNDPLTSTSAALLNTTTAFIKGLGYSTVNPVEGMSQMTSSLVKGSMVEIPMALTEGMRNIPRLYGEKPEKVGPIDGWKDGMKQAGKGFYTGFADGISGFITKPYREAKANGAMGFTKGFAKGSIELFTKPGAAMFGLMAYPSMGIYKSLRKKDVNQAETRILKAQIALWEHTVEQVPISPEEIQTVLSKFQDMA
ncbi:Sterol 3-beta-glucosyltransferase UGT80A2, partial [Penicillium rolfsii]